MQRHGGLVRPFRTHLQISQHTGRFPPFRLRVAPGPAKQADFVTSGVGQIGRTHGKAAQPVAQLPVHLIHHFQPDALLVKLGR